MKKIIGIIAVLYLAYYTFHILKDLFFTKEKVNNEIGERYSFESRTKAKRITEDSLKEDIRRENDNPTEEEFENMFYSTETLDDWDSAGEGIDNDYKRYSEEQRMEEIKAEALIENKPKIEKEIEQINQKTINSTDTQNEEKTAKEIATSKIKNLLNSYDTIDTSKEVSVIGYKLAELGT